MSQAAATHFNRNIHGLRGVAALMVFFFHIFDMSEKLGVMPALDMAGRVAVISLSGGVEIFFMISGYLIVASLNRHQNNKTFLLDRFARIYPVFFTLHVMCFVAAPFIGYKWLSGVGFSTWLLHFLSNGLLLPGVFDLPLVQLSAWSLSYELLFYLVAALAFTLARRNGMLAWGVIAASAVALMFTHHSGAFFLVGALCYRLTREGVQAPPRLVAALAFFGFMALNGYASYLMHDAEGPAKDAVGIYRWASLVPGAVFFYAVIQRAGYASAVLRQRWMQFMGSISYSFYLIGGVAAFPLKHVMAKLIAAGHVSPMAGIVAFTVLLLAVTTFASWLSWLVLEQRAGKWLRSHLHKPVPRPEPLPA